MRVRIAALGVCVAVAVCGTFGSPTAAQQAPSVIVVFADGAPFASFRPAVADARSRANQAAWDYLDRAVVGTVQALERQYGFRADYVYSAAVRGFAARLTSGQVDALRRDPLVGYIEPDTPMQSLEQTLPWGIDRIDADVSSVRSGDGQGRERLSSRPMSVY